MESIISNIIDLNNFLKRNESKEKGITINLFNQFKKETNFDMLDFIVKNLDDFSKCGLEYVNLLTSYERLPKKTFIKICDFYKSVSHKLNLYVCVNHSYESKYFDETSQIKWDIKTIIDANEDINRVCDFIKKNNLSQLETLAFIHNYVSNIANYHSSNTLNHSWHDKDQYFAGIYQKCPEVVCMGYSSLMKEIIDSLDMPGLECEIISVSYEDIIEDIKCGHARCYIKVKDDKYGINQSCFDDPTWDRPKFNNTSTYNHFAISNKCHEAKFNSVFNYYIPKFEKVEKTKCYRHIEDYNPCIAEYNNGKNKLDQITIEKIFFNMLQKTNKSKCFDEIYQKLQTMAEKSYVQQSRYGYKGYLTEQDLKLSLSEAKNLYDDNLKKDYKFYKNSLNFKVENQMI